MNLSQLEVFAAIVNAGSLKAAADEVGLTHSAISYSLSKLEAEMGVRLVERGRHGVTLTRIGEEVLHHVRIVLAEIEVIRQKTARERGISTGKIRFACVPQVPSRFLTGIIRDFQHQYPDIQVVLFQGSSEEITHWLANRIVDVGTVVDTRPYPHAVRLVESELHVLLPESHRLAHTTSVHLSDLRDEPLIGSGRESNMVTVSLSGADAQHINLRYQVTETATIYAMVVEGMGVSILPSMLIDPEINGVISIPLRPRLTMQANLATHAASPVNLAFLKIAQNWAKQHGYVTPNP